MEPQNDIQSNPISETSQSEDARLVEEIFECAAKHSDDWTADVFQRFFQRCPESVAHFRLAPEGSGQPPQGCGQMLFEATCLILDSANGLPYVDSYVQQIVTEHKAFGIEDRDLYGEFFTAMREELRALIGADWTSVRSAAWDRQISSLVERGFALTEAEQT
jgi:hemoglobin-like flavoprotein